MPIEAKKRASAHHPRTYPTTVRDPIWPWGAVMGLLENLIELTLLHLPQPPRAQTERGKAIRGEVQAPQEHQNECGPSAKQ
eukprot:3988727-Pyramimonas_sp.AAC.1